MFSKDNEKLKIIVIGGPTCTGKSDLGLYIAEMFNGEIVNADSMQVYRYFNIGTAKPSIDVRNRILHHMIDIVNPDEEFNAAMFKDGADRVIREIHSRGHIPVVVGGTGLYLRVLLHGIFKVPTDKKLRASLQEQYTRDPEGTYKELKRLDPVYASKVSKKDKIRIVRALEIYRLTGKNMSGWEKEHGFKEEEYLSLKIGLTKDRKSLYERIDKRVDKMLSDGWIEEVNEILEMGYKETCKPFSGIGYREILHFLKGLITYEDMVKDIKKFTRHYAKRQFTWFSKERGFVWYTFPEALEKIKKEVYNFLKNGT
ncbi:MAG: tRNA (adenosine(37)-N6)-dimethylallyltransferase MiaA [Syntrophorhabdaceae bacterium]|nr:tRNA (adenosine(37)-N6)-dimethylallyltransferase MiaA [Syntrophorhabdaceae bacterium]